LKELHRSCQNEKGEDDQKKGSQLVDIYALEIQMHTETKDINKLKESHRKALDIESAIPHPRIMGIIQECGGKLHMKEKEWDQGTYRISFFFFSPQNCGFSSLSSTAYTDFFEAFKNYDETGRYYLQEEKFQFFFFFLILFIFTVPVESNV